MGPAYKELKGVFFLHLPTRRMFLLIPPSKASYEEEAGALHGGALRDGGTGALREPSLLKRRTHFEWFFVDSHLGRAILLMLRSWPSTQPVLAACARSASVQFAQQPDRETSEQPKEPWDAYGLSHPSTSALPTELQALAFSLHSQSGSLKIECVTDDNRADSHCEGFSPACCSFQGCNLKARG